MRKKLLYLEAVLIFALSLFVFGSVGCADTEEQISSYDITAELIDNTVYGKEKCVFYNSTDNMFTELKFNLFANAFREGATFSPISEQYKNQAYYSGADYGKIEIESVSDGNGNSLEFSVCGTDENILKVNANKEIFPRESFEVNIEYEINLACVIARTGINKNTINLADFYPILCGIEEGGFYECVYYATGDPYFSDCADYTVTFTCDEKYVVASSGKTVGCQNKEGKRTDVFKVEKARSFAMVLSEKFEMISDNSTGVEINYYYYKDSSPEKSLKTATLAIQYYSDTFGEYAYPTFAVVQTEFVQGGMEFPALVMISDSLEERAYSEVIIHETAHEWWFAGVGNNQIKYAYMDEGLTEYSVVMFYENHPDYGYNRSNLMESAEKTYKMFCTVYDRLNLTVDTTMMRAINEYSSEYEYVNIAYVKGCIMFDDLRTFTGDKIFIDSLKEYYKRYLFDNASPEDLSGAFEKNKKEAASFIDGYLSGKVIIG